MERRHRKSELFASLTPVFTEDLLPKIRECVAAFQRKLVVLDDDPTGTQTVHGVPVLTQWDEGTLRAEFANNLPCFYILTNSRSLPPDAARALGLEIALNLKAAADPRTFTLVSRSDSTLRGHFPVETDALAEILGPFDATILIPYFEAGGRYTIDDVHYVAEGDWLLPAAETPFARDAVFGYRNSNLREYIQEKTGGRVKAPDVISFSIAELRTASPHHEPTRSITVKLMGLQHGKTCIVNACHPRDMEFFALASTVAERSCGRYLFRTAAQFVAARLGQEPKVLNYEDQQFSPGFRQPAGTMGENRPGGLLVIGSYVPKTTEQLQSLMGTGRVVHFEIRTADVLDPTAREETILQTAFQAALSLKRGLDTVISTSRTLVQGQDAGESLLIGQQVSDTLVALVKRIEVRPRYFVAKGGITSSDLATKGLGVKRAMVLGQILPGVPVWELGPETKYPEMPYIVFPGNVGDAMSLVELVEKLR